MTSVVEIQPTVTAPAHGQAHDRADDRAQRQAQDLRPVPTHQALAVVCALVFFATPRNRRSRERRQRPYPAGTGRPGWRPPCVADGPAAVLRQRDGDDCSSSLVIVVGAGSYSDVH